MMSNVNQVTLDEMWPFMEEQIKNGKKVRFGPKGTSMLPMIRQGIDTVILAAAPEKLKKYDLPLFRRANGQFVLHRVVGLRKDGYVMRGDNQFINEYGVKDADILALVVGFYRGEEYVPCDDKKYLSYCMKLVRNRELRMYIMEVKSGLKKFIKKITKGIDKEGKE